MKMTEKRLAGRIISFIVLFALLFTSGLADGYGSGPERVSAAEPYVNDPDFIGLKDAYADYFLMGVCMPQNGSWYHSDGLRTRTFKNTFNSMTCENEFKPYANFSASSPTLYHVDTSADAMLRFCHENGIKMRYHTLVWHGQINASIFGKDFKVTANGKATTNAADKLDKECLVDKETLLERLKTYIYGAMEYIYSNGYAETVYAFDVVNEAVDEGKADGLRQSYWYQIIGPEYLYYCFLYAREAELTYSKQYADLYGLDPEGDLSSIIPGLFLNDYNEWFSARVNVITRLTTQKVWNEGQSMVRSFAIAENGDGTMKGDGLIDGIGLQGHLSDNNNIDEYLKALQKYSEAVGEVQITELDVGCTHSDQNRWYYQAKFYYDFFSRLIEAKESGVNLTSVTIWGLSDNYTWRSGTDPTVYNSDFSKKAAYDALLLAAAKEDFTLSRAETITDLKDLFIDLEPYQEGGKTILYSPAKAGFVARGTGHQSKLEMGPKVNHTPDVVIGYSVKVMREEQDATAMMEASDYSGRNITFTAYVKTDDKVIRTGLECGQTIFIKEVEAKDEWNVVSFNYDMPKTQNSIFIYFETDGNADMYIDDISLIYTRDGEEPAPVAGEENKNGTEQAGGDVSDGETAADVSTAGEDEKSDNTAPVSDTQSTGSEKDQNDAGTDAEQEHLPVVFGHQPDGCQHAERHDHHVAEQDTERQPGRAAEAPVDTGLQEGKKSRTESEDQRQRQAEDDRIEKQLAHHFRDAK